MAYRDEEFFDEEGWNAKHDCFFFIFCGYRGGISRSPRKLAAARENLVKANAARRAKAEARRQRQADSGIVPSDDHL